MMRAESRIGQTVLSWSRKERHGLDAHQGFIDQACADEDDEATITRPAATSISFKETTPRVCGAS
jgi:hypothetical protein